MRITLLVFILLLYSTVGALPGWTGAPLAEQPLLGAVSNIVDSAHADLDTFEGLVGKQIIKELGAVRVLKGHIIMGERIRSGEDLVRFYERRKYIPAWVTDFGPRKESYRLVQVIRLARSEGLEPEDYHPETLKRMLEATVRARGDMKNVGARQLAQLDILMSDAFITYSRHAGYGRVPPQELERFWGSERSVPDLAALLQDALDTGRLDEVLWSLPPQHPGYVRLRDALSRYRRIASGGGWPRIEGGPSMRMGDMGERVKALRQRLAVSGELSEDTDAGAHVFGTSLEKAVMRFQSNHGIKTDGIVGKDTLAALNVPVEERIKQVRVNMERWRWLPRELGDRHILVDITAFRLFTVDGGTTVMSMEAIVGKDYRNTPVFSGIMTYLVLGPYWNVPHTIAVEDKLPRIQKDPAYLESHGYEVFAGWDPDAGPLDPDTIDWTELSADNFPYRLRQKPGPNNALGRVKFMFPNKHAVYIHDTPEKSLFNRSVRMFSSGCIRISKPLELAEYLLKDKPGWDRKAILRAIIRWNEQAVRIKPVLIHLVYFTVQANGDGTLEFRNDVYGRDAPLRNILLPGGLESIDQ